MSAKTSTQQGRRTPLSLSGTVTKTHPNKGGNAANGSGNNSNGHATSNSNKQDNKFQKEKNEQTIANNADAKENPNKKQQTTIDKKPQQNDNKKSNEKSQNGANSNKQQQSIENKQQQLHKEKPQQQNGNEDKKINEKDKKEMSEKSDKLDKPKEKSEKEDTKLKDDKKLDQDKHENKKEEKKTKDVKDTKEDKKEVSTKSDAKIEQQGPIQENEKKSKEENNIENNKKFDEKIEDIMVVEEQPTQEKPTIIPTTPKSNSKTNKTLIAVNKTPTRVGEKTPQKSTPTNTVKTTFITKREETTTTDDNDIEMEPLAIESSPVKSSQPEDVANVKITPSATSTPGKMLLPKRNSGVPKSDVQLAMQTGFSPDRHRTFSQISGRKSIRPISDYTPSKFQSNLQYRESYRRLTTELDATNTSMNVTVGSEAPNNLSFSFFGRGRKRDRTPPKHSQSSIGELQTDIENSPPKKARLDMHGFFSVVASPLSLLRNRFSKASLQSSTPVKLQQKLNTAEDDVEVQNVSGESVHEEIGKSDKEPVETNKTVNDITNALLGEEAKTAIVITVKDDVEAKGLKDTLCEKVSDMEQNFEQSDIKIKETLLQTAVGDPMAKNKRCIVM